MTHHDNSDSHNTILQLLNDHGTEGFAECLRILVNEAMRQERSTAIQADPYERSDQRLAYANGYKDKTVATRMGPVRFSVPQVRGDVGFYPNALEKGIRSEQALNLAMAEMYVQGVSTRKVSAIVEQLCGHSVSSTTVSKCAAKLDVELDAWRERPLGTFAYLVLDARYEKVRQGGQLLDCAVLIAMGIDEQGKRAILGVSVMLSEAEVHWRTFLQSLQARGLTGVKFITSDAHPGLAAARAATFPSVPWQRCQFHLQKNAQTHVPRIDQRSKVASDIRAVFNCPDLATANTHLKSLVRSYHESAPKLALWMESNIPEGLTVFSLPASHQRRMRTSNAIERVNQELKRRTRVASLFPNEPSLLRLVSALLCEINDEWQTGKIYLNMKPADLPDA